MDTTLTPASPHARALIADTESSLGEGLVPAAIYNDPELHRLELERIFARTWVFIGHESEIPSPGDYRLRYIGEDPFIFIRDEQGAVRCLFDACTHRGAQICRAEKGNASHFRCPYHGWTFQNDGRLVGLPAAKMAYEGMDRTCFDLNQAPRVEIRHGFVFASLEPEGPTLAEYLGDFAWYFDLHFALGNPRVVGDPHRWLMDVNWKIGAENFSGDDYHTLTLHKSMWDLGLIPVPAAANMMGNHIQAGGEWASHSMSFSIDPSEDGPPPHYWGLTDEQVAQLDQSRVDPEQMKIARRARVTVGTIFPNLSLILLALSRDPKRKPPSIMFGVRQWQPRGPNGMELWSWVFAWDELPAAYQREMYLNHASTFGTSGIFEQDDTEPWSSMTRTGGSTFARKSRMKLNYKMGHAGVGSSEVITDFPGPGTVWSNRYEEGVQRNLVWNWVKWMTDDVPDPGSKGRRDLRDLNLQLVAEREARKGDRQ